MVIEVLTNCESKKIATKQNIYKAVEVFKLIASSRLKEDDKIQILTAATRRGIGQEILENLEMFDNQIG